VINPADQSVLGIVPHATRSDLDDALAAAEQGFKVWSHTSPAKRAEIILKAVRLMRTRLEDMALAMTLEQGKPVAQSRLHRCCPNTGTRRRTARTTGHVAPDDLRWCRASRAPSFYALGQNIAPAQYHLSQETFPMSVTEQTCLSASNVQHHARMLVNGAWVGSTSGPMSHVENSKKRRKIEEVRAATQPTSIAAFRLRCGRLLNGARSRRVSVGDPFGGIVWRLRGGPQGRIVH
jgi:hypothetical protein